LRCRSAPPRLSNAGTNTAHHGGDCIIFIGRVERYAYTNRPTPLFGRGKYIRGEPLLPG
jgi:hypothetical protein